MLVAKGFNARPVMFEKGKILFVGVFLLTILPLFALATSPSFKILTTEQGLAHDTVTKIVRDSRGFIWFCTSEGLSRFDGTRFTNFTQSEGLPFRSATDFLELRDGTILVGTGRGISIFNPLGKAFAWNMSKSGLERTDDSPAMFQTFTPNDTTWQSGNVRSLAQDADNVIWAGMEVGLYRLTIASAVLEFRAFELEPGKPTMANRLIPDSKGGLIVVGTTGLFRIFQNKVSKFSDSGGDDGFESRDGRIWVTAGGTSDGVRIFEFSGDTLVQTKRFTKTDGLISDIHIRAALQMSDGRIFVAGDSLGLAEFEPEFGQDKPAFRSLRTDKILSLGEDTAGNLWVGTDSKGVYQMPKSGFVRYGEADGIPPGTEITSVTPARSGGMILTIAPGRLLYLDDSGRFRDISSPLQIERSWGWNFLDFEATNGEWWIPTRSGLKRFARPESPYDLSASHPIRVYKASDGLWSDEVFTIFEDSRGDVWATVSTGGLDTLSRWDRKLDKIVSYSSVDGLPAGNGAISFAEDKSGNVWFGHYFGKIARYRAGKFETFGEADGLSESRIDDLLVDDRGRLWITTSGHGLFRIDDPNQDKPSFQSISSQNGLSSNQVRCLTMDASGRVYAGTGRGIARIDEAETVRTFTQFDGLPGNNVSHCASDSSGNLWFVSQNVLLRHKPEIETLTIPAVFIDRFSANGVQEAISVLGETNARMPDLASNRTQIEIEYFALTFGAGENILYQYRIDDHEWSSPSRQQMLNLSLGYGLHKVQVRAVRPDGTVSIAPATASFRILSPIWLRWWFVLLVAIIVFGAVVMLFRYRVANLKAINAALSEAKDAEERLRIGREERLAELEQVRTRIATDLHDDIGSSLTQIAILAEVARQRTVASRTDPAASEPLTMIYSASNELVSTMSDIVWSINPKKDHLHDLTLRMRRFASDILTARSVDFEFEAPHEIEDFQLNSNLRREVFLIFKESINNIVKHANATRVDINLSIEAGSLFLSIIDDGRGFDVTEKFVDSEAKLFANYQGGNGLLNMQRRAREMRGEFTVVSSLTNGTTVRLRLPLAIQLGSDLSDGVY